MINYVEPTEDEEARYTALYELKRAREDVQCTLRHIKDLARKHSSVPELQLAEQHIRVAASLLLACETITENADIANSG